MQRTWTRWPWMANRGVNMGARSRKPRSTGRATILKRLENGVLWISQNAKDVDALAMDGQSRHKKETARQNLAAGSPWAKLGVKGEETREFSICQQA